MKKNTKRKEKNLNKPFHYITTHFAQQPACSSGSSTPICFSGRPLGRAPTAPPWYDDISRLYLRISRTIS